MGTRSAQKYLTAGSSILGWEKMLSKFYHNKRQEKQDTKLEISTECTRPLAHC